MNSHGSLNRIYRLVWSQITNSFVAVAENARGRGKGKNRNRKLVATALALSAVTWLMPEALAGPTGGKVVSGSASIIQSKNTTTIIQKSLDTTIDWSSFNLATNETVNFVQASENEVAINAILGNSASQILGHINAGAEIFLINPNGFVFGKSANVNVGGLVASALALNGSSQLGLRFSGTGTIDNQGLLSAGRHVVLLGSSVTNEGTISAPLGTIVLGAGNSATLNLNNNQVSLKIDGSTLQNLISNGGLIVADGGAIILTAGAKNELLGSVVNNIGVLQARTVGNHDGVISLLADMGSGTVNVGGTLDASAPDGGDGGAVTTNASAVHIGSDAKVMTLASHGKTGNWLIDPADFTIAPSGGDETGADLSAALVGSNITITSDQGKVNPNGSGNINVNDVVSWSANTLTLQAQANINVNAPMNVTGSAALSLQFGLAAVNAGNPGQLNVNAPINLNSSAQFPYSTQQGSDGALVNYNVINSLGSAGAINTNDGTLQGMSATGNYVLGSTIDATPTGLGSWLASGGFTPIASGSSFTGILDGLGHTITNLTINRSGTNQVGLFATAGTGSILRNLGLVNASVQGGSYTGALAGTSQGTVSDSYSMGGSVTGNYTVGGLMGLGSNANISNSYAVGNVQGSNYAGGLAGIALHSQITNCYASGTVQGQIQVGGLIGWSNASTVANSYANASVQGTSIVGSLIGYSSDSTLNITYASGSVSGSSFTGGIIGVNQASTVTSSYWINPATSQGTSAANFSGFNFVSAPVAGNSGNYWVMVNADGTLASNNSSATGATFPMLASEYSTSITNAHQLQLVALNLAANYTLANNVNAAATGTPNADVWSTSAGFVPLGNLSTSFTGSFNGQGHTISNLFINNTGLLGVGLFSETDNSSTISNLGLINASIEGIYDVGAMVGDALGTISNSYVSGSSVNGTVDVGGMIGYGAIGVISNSYVSASNVSGGTAVGGLAGELDAGFTINNSYSAALVNATVRLAGGLVGFNSEGQVNNSFWDTSTSGQAGSSGGIGMTTAQMKTQANFTEANPPYNNGFDTTQPWDFGSTWFMYPGQTYPLLQVFMKPLTIDVSNITTTYNGAPYAGPITATYSITPDPTHLLGSLYFPSAPGSSQSAEHAGTYNVGGLYSDQQGYMINYTDGLLTINPIVLTVTGQVATNKVYDGTSTATFVPGSGQLQGVLAGDNVTLNQSGDFYGASTFCNAIACYTTFGPVSNAGTYQVITSDTLGSNPYNDYVLTQPSTLSNPTMGASITPAQLTVTGLAGTGRAYNGSVVDALTGSAVLNGLVSGESFAITSPTGTLASANAGSEAVTANVTLGAGSGGASASNYTLIEPTLGNVTITPEALTVSTANVVKTYNGSTTAVGSPDVVSGTLYNGDTLSGGSFAFTSPGAGIGNKTVTVFGIAIANSADAGNYALTDVNNTTSTINPATLTVNAGTEFVIPKFYDGTTNAYLSGGTLSGIIKGDTVTLSDFGNYVSANAGCPASGGTGCNTTAVIVKDVLTGSSAANYTLSQPTKLSGYLIAAPLLATGTAQNKVYNGTTAATMSNVTLYGVIAGQTINLSESGTFASSNVGKWTVTVKDTLSAGSGTLLSNYFLLDPTWTTTASITPATLLYTATSAVSKVGATPSGLTGKVTGFVAGQTLATATTGNAVWTSNATSKSPAGTYYIDGSGLTADYGNYVFAQAPGNATALVLTKTGSNLVQAASDVTQSGTAAAASGAADDQLVRDSSDDSKTVLTTKVPAQVYPLIRTLKIKNGGVKLPQDSLAMN